MPRYDRQGGRTHRPGSDHPPSECLFTEGERRELCTPYPDRIIARIRGSRFQEALELTEEMKQSRIHLHDSFADSCTVLWSWIGENLGEAVVEEMFRYVFEQSARRQLYSMAVLLRLYVRNSITLLAGAGWRSHACFGYGEHPAAFSVTEDEEKFTFHLHPCASGGRLWLRGLYQPGRGGKVTEGAHRWAFNRKGFPYYCIHSTFLNEILPYEAIGYILWPTDEPQEPGGPCRWHLYKDPNAIPDSYYARLGLRKHAVAPVRARRQRRFYFSKEELQELSRPMTDRIREKIEAGDAGGAVALCRQVKDEFLFLHDLYVNMLVATLTFLSDRAGESRLGDALAFQYEKALAPIAEQVGQLGERDAMAFIACRIFGVDNCNQTGLPRGRFSMDETDDALIFHLDPCGSGGRLLRGRAYAPMGRRRKWREALADAFFMNACRMLPLPDALLEWMFRGTGGFITQRKPYGQGKTRTEHPWSFGKRNVPYYCCQCGMFQQKVGTALLDIDPPEDRKSPCVWRIRKRPGR